MTAPLFTRAGALSPEARVARYRVMARSRGVDERIATLWRAEHVGFRGAWAESMFADVHARLPWHPAGQRSEPRGILGDRAALSVDG